MKIYLNEGKQSVKTGVWYIGRKRKYSKRKLQRGQGFPIGLLATAATPIALDLAKALFKKIFSGGRIRRLRREKK